MHVQIRKKPLDFQISWTKIQFLMGFFLFVSTISWEPRETYVTYINYLPMTTNSPRVLLNLQECYKITASLNQHLTILHYALMPLLHYALPLNYYIMP